MNKNSKCEHFLSFYFLKKKSKFEKEYENDVELKKGKKEKKKRNKIEKGKT